MKILRLYMYGAPNLFEKFKQINFSLLFFSLFIYLSSSRFSFYHSNHTPEYECLLKLFANFALKSALCLFDLFLLNMHIHICMILNIFLIAILHFVRFCNSTATKCHDCAITNLYDDDHDSIYFYC